MANVNDCKFQTDGIFSISETFNLLRLINFTTPMNFETDCNLFSWLKYVEDCQGHRGKIFTMYHW